MKKIIVLLVLAAMAATMSAQQIAVVTSNGSTTMCQTLADAISKAGNNSVIYLPAGGFQISDDVKITHKITIVGVTHKANSDNAEGNTVISGSLFFNEGSSNSCVMGCYISGNIKIGWDNSSVNNILVKYCNVNAVDVYSNKCSGTKVNQNYLRATCELGYSEATYTNNVMYRLTYMTGGLISNNIFCYGGNGYTMNSVNNATISNNIFIYASFNSIGSCQITNNMTRNYDWGDDSINLHVDNWNGVFKKNLGVTPASEFEFIGDYATYNGKVGIYCTDDGGTGFSDGCMPPVPYVSIKRIDEQTDASGNLKVQVRVTAVSE